MGINLESVIKDEPVKSMDELLLENRELVLAIEEAYRAIRWYITTLSLAILTHNDALIINNNLLGVLDGKEVHFDVKPIEDKDGFVKLMFSKEEEKIDESIHEEKGN